MAEQDFKTLLLYIEREAHNPPNGDPIAALKEIARMAREGLQNLE